MLTPGHNTALSVRGLVSDEMIAYHEVRAEAGVGMITMEVSTVHPPYAPYGRLSVVTDGGTPVRVFSRSITDPGRHIPMSDSDRRCGSAPGRRGHCRR